MSDKVIFDPEKISFADFKLVKGQVDIPEDFVISKVDGHHLENSLQLGFNLDEELIRADFIVEIKTESNGKNNMEAIVNFHFVYIFHVEKLIEFAKPNKNNLIELDPYLGNAISSITYSTSRGVMLTRLQGTALQNFILPIINPNKLLHGNKQ